MRDGSFPKENRDAVTKRRWNTEQAHKTCPLHQSGSLIDNKGPRGPVRREDLDYCMAEQKLEARTPNSCLVPSIFVFDLFILVLFIQLIARIHYPYENINMYKGQMGLTLGSSPYQLIDFRPFIYLLAALVSFLFVMRAMIVPTS